MRSPDIAAIASLPSIAAEADALAAKRSKKAELLIESTGQFVQIERPSHKDLLLYKELFYQLVDGCEQAERRKLAMLLSRNPFTPRQIALFFAIDNKDVAAPILLFSPVLNEADIAILARRLPGGHLAVLCRRANLTVASVRALARYGGRDCRRLLEKNPVILGSPELFGTLSGKAPLSRKERIGEALATERREAEPAKSDPTPKATATRRTGPAERQLMALAARGGRLGEAASTEHGVRGAAIGAGPLNRSLLAAARGKKRDALGCIIAERTGLAVNTVEAALNQASFESMAVLFKCMDLDPLTAMQLLLLLDRQTAASGERYADARAFYQRLDAHRCRQALGARAPQDAKAEDHAPASKVAGASQATNSRPEKGMTLGMLAAQRRQEISASLHRSSRPPVAGADRRASSGTRD